MRALVARRPGGTAKPGAVQHQCVLGCVHLSTGGQETKSLAEARLFYWKLVELIRIELTTS